MEKRTIIAVGLSIAVFYLFSMLFGPDKKKVDPAAVPAAPSKVEALAPKSGALPELQNPVSASGLSPVANLSQKDIAVETDLYTALFSSRGASLKSLTLKNYRETNVPNSDKVTLCADSDPNIYSFSTTASGFNLPDNALYGADIDSLCLLYT